MRYLASLALLCHLALGTPSTPPSEHAARAAVFEVDRFFAGSLPPSTRNFVIFSVQPTPGADFANCTINTNTGPKVPTVDKVVCTDINSITWSLEPMGTGMHFSVWWAFTSHASLLGGIHLDESYFKDTTLADGSTSQSYIGPHKFTLETTMVMNNPGGKRETEESMEQL
ncbi:hypothetical protein BDP81DRAFT_323871 [Colletotrichum phormii]|uniref:AA1-like domain-containing protein n=1 Tax=Colletotrichum phormii TaxID=359342 RepID=A0AAI9ZMW9_9PEZI|nr:uncharacterized protein BDP81DRAFT_323871 [Colletotrichum phormii]KAK1634936.1 hypothetical protein BDP81DRAFT_323871 [Colletotrichum phormii]